MTLPLENTGTVSDSKCCLRSIFQTIQKLQILQPPERYKSKFLVSISLNSDKLQYFAMSFGAVVAPFFFALKKGPWPGEILRNHHRAFHPPTSQSRAKSPCQRWYTWDAGRVLFRWHNWGLILGQTQRIPGGLKPRRLSPTKSLDFLCMIYIYIYLFIYLFIYITYIYIYIYTIQYSILGTNPL